MGLVLFYFVFELVCLFVCFHVTLSSWWLGMEMGSHQATLSRKVDFLLVA